MQMDFAGIGGRREGCVGDLIGGMRICTVTNNSTNKNRSTTQLDSARRSGTRSRTPLQQLALHHGCRVTQVFSLLARRFKADKHCKMSKGLHEAFCAGVARKKTGRNKSRAALRMRQIVECWSAEANRVGSPSLSLCEQLPVCANRLPSCGSSALSFVPLPTTPSSSAPTDTHGGGRQERGDGTAAREAQHTVKGKRAVSKVSWSTTSQGVPFPRQTSLQRAPLRLQPPSVCRLVLGHLCSFRPQTSRIVISVMPYLRGK